MNIIGRGMCGVVVGDTETSVKKFYKVKEDWEKEKTRLAFLTSMKEQGFDIDCTIPKLISASAGGEWSVNGKTYNYCAKMELIPGVRADVKFNREELEKLGTSLGTALFIMHSTSGPFVSQWINSFGSDDELFDQILKEKATKVLAEETDKRVLSWVAEVKGYLEDQEAQLMNQRCLSHIDLNLPNIIVNNDDHSIEGLVDWGAFGLTSSSMSMYQLVGKSDLWTHVKKQYMKLGGTIREDILCAAATIHLAWAPIICKEVGMDIPKDDTPKKLEDMYACFAAHRFN
jgi:aminoglycoside phosphotransferase